MKRILVGIGIAGILVVSGGVLAQPASALTVDELQAQIKELLAKVGELTKQLNILQGQNTTPPDTSSTSMPAKHRICNMLKRNLSQGTQGDDVRGLQEFLSTEGYLSANATGYFGPATAAAVAKWQSSEGVSSVGSIGPMSRERIKIWCGGLQNTGSFSATPTRGEAPLTVLFKTNRYNQRECELTQERIYPTDGGSVNIDFGDGQRTNVDWCRSSGIVQHTYQSTGTYTATYNSVGPFSSQVTQTTLGKVQINVGPIACTKEYKPVCGKPNTCLTGDFTNPPGPPAYCSEGKTYSNRCMMNADGASFLYEGQCRSSVPNNAKENPDKTCKVWTYNCFQSCSREYADAPATCRQMFLDMSLEDSQRCETEGFRCQLYFSSAGN